MDLKDVKKIKNLYDMHEISEFMGVSYITLYRMIKDGKINTVNVAKSGKRPIYAFRAEDIQEFYDHQEKTGEGHTE